MVALQELVAEHVGERNLTECQIVALGDVEGVGCTLVAAVGAGEAERTVGAVGTAHVVALAVAEVGVDVVARDGGDVALLVPGGRSGGLVESGVVVAEVTVGLCAETVVDYVAGREVGHHAQGEVLVAECVVERAHLVGVDIAAEVHVVLVDDTVLVEVVPDGVASNLALAEAGGMHNLVVGSACGFLVGGIYAVHLECELCAEAFALGETAYLYILAELLI